MWQIQFLFPPKYGDFGLLFLKNPLNIVFGRQVAKIHPGHYM
jgi:hypothetical protein